MNILICDTNTSDANHVTAILDYSYGSAIRTTVFHSVSDAIFHVQSGANVDICFLETVVPEMDGIELARELRAGGYKGEIAFLTESKRYGPEAFEVKAISYLLKPAMPEQIRNVVQMVRHKLQKIDKTNPKMYNKIEIMPCHRASRLERIKLFLHEIV